MKSILSVFLALAMFAASEAGAKAECDLGYVDGYQQEQTFVKADNTRSKVDSGSYDGDFRVNANEQANSDEESDDNDEDEEDDGGGMDRVWDAVELG